MASIGIYAKYYHVDPMLVLDMPWDLFCEFLKVRNDQKKAEEEELKKWRQTNRYR